MNHEFEEAAGIANVGLWRYPKGRSVYHKRDLGSCAPSVNPKCSTRGRLHLPPALLYNQNRRDTQLRPATGCGQASTHPSFRNPHTLV